MVAESVFLIKAAYGNYWDFDNRYKKTAEKRLIMTCVGQIALGDRDTGMVTVKGNKLILGPSQYRETQEEIELD